MDKVKEERQAWSPSRTNKWNRERSHRKKLEMLSNLSGIFYGVYPRIGRDGKIYYKHYWRGKRSTYLKHVSNKKIRRYQGEIPCRGGYKKVFDYWWELF